MRSYRLYVLNDQGKVARAWGIEARSDRHAIAEAGKMQLGVDTHLWKQGRQIAQIPA